ncbi:alginate lyase family protein [Rhizobium sp. 768_B6_N1_8]|uniref:alginate lyase family protein n=1 Tax=unclassified Rhizobium TaxID=2613769 RepID=UPI003F21F523
MSMVSRKARPFSFTVSWFFSGLLLFATPAAAEPPLRYLFEKVPADTQEDGSAKRTRPFVCSVPVAPLVDMSKLFGFYKPSQTQSEVDPVAMKAYVKRLWPTGAVTKKMLEMMETALDMPGQGRNAANCIIRQMRVWASADALLGSVEDNDPLGHRQAVLIGGWTSISFSNAYAVAEEVSPPASSADVPIKAWFAKLSDMIVAEFTPAPRERKYAWLDGNSNHRYWAAAAVGLMAVHLQDRKRFNWSMDILKSALDEVPEDGGLPRELARGGRALKYQNFAMDAIAILVRLADVNDITLDADQEKKLQSVAGFAATMYRHPDQLETRTGYRQEVEPEMIAWIDVLLPHFKGRDPEFAEKLDAIAKPLRPMTNTFIALPSTRLIGDEGAE